MWELAMNEKNLTVFLRPRGGGLLYFSWYVDLDQKSTVHKYQAYPQNNWKLATPKNIPILYLDLKKKP